MTTNPDPELAAAARAVLDADGRDYLLQGWQVAYLIALADGREGVVPPGCGVGRGWLDTRLREALAELPARTPDPRQASVLPR